jgi:hypothetical protein
MVSLGCDEKKRTKKEKTHHLSLLRQTRNSETSLALSALLGKLIRATFADSDEGGSVSIIGISIIRGDAKRGVG